MGPHSVCSYVPDRSCWSIAGKILNSGLSIQEGPSLQQTDRVAGLPCMNGESHCSNLSEPLSSRADIWWLSSLPARQALIRIPDTWNKGSDHQLTLGQATWSGLAKAKWILLREKNPQTKAGFCSEKKKMRPREKQQLNVREVILSLREGPKDEISKPGLQNFFVTKSLCEFE